VTAAGGAASSGVEPPAERAAGGKG
jgi:hypothetical protein